jgi:hypothetical protein
MINYITQQHLSVAIANGLTDNIDSWFADADIDKCCTGPLWENRSDINLWTWVIYDRENIPPEGTILRFQEFNQIVSQIPEVIATHLAFIGPYSIVPKHGDSTARGRNPTLEYNLLLGCVAPTSPSKDVVLDVMGVEAPIVKGRGILFDGEKDHWAYNNTDKWVVTSTLYLRGLK